MLQGNTMLSEDVLTSLLPQKTLNKTLFIFETLPSTNTWALQLAKQQECHGTLVIADQQTAGRGRLDRQWFSPPGTNIYGSLVFRAEKNLSEVGWIPLVIGLAIAETLENDSQTRVSLKWPNDIFMSGKKVGGVLCETSGFGKDNQSIVVGFGINVNVLPTDFPQDLQDTSTSLQIVCGRLIDRNTLIAEITQTIEKYWHRTITCDDKSWLQTYSKKCVTIGQRIRAELPEGQTVEGKVNGIGEQGQLQIVLPHPGKKEEFHNIDLHSGEIQHIRHWFNAAG